MLMLQQHLIKLLPAKYVHYELVELDREINEPLLKNELVATSTCARVL